MKKAKKVKVIGITGRHQNKLAKSVARRTLRILKKLGVKYQVAGNFRLVKDKAVIRKLEDFDCDIVLAFGGDGTLLHTIRESKKQIPVAGINCGTIGHLTEINATRIGNFLEQIIQGDYYLEKRTRLQAVCQGVKIPIVLNEYAIAPVKSNTIMRYKLTIDGKQAFSDLADGLIVATSTGSTAHALSAGGPEIEHDVDAVVIVPVNSTDKNKRPLVVRANSKIVISDLASKAAIETVSDGHVHTIIKGKVEITKARPAIFVRIKKPEHLSFEDIYMKLTPSAKFVLEVLNHHGMLTQKEIMQDTRLPKRTIQRALSQLLEEGLVSEKQFMVDEKVKGYLVRGEQ